MMLLPVVCSLLVILSLIDAQSKVRIAIMDDMTYSRHPINLQIPNITFCGRDELQLQLSWMNTTDSLISLFDRLQADQNPTDIYLTRTSRLPTELIQDFCQLSRRPFVNMQPSANEINLCLTTAYVLWLFFFSSLNWILLLACQISFECWWITWNTNTCIEPSISMIAKKRNIVSIVYFNTSITTIISITSHLKFEPPRKKISIHSCTILNPIHLPKTWRQDTFSWIFIPTLITSKCSKRFHTWVRIDRSLSPFTNLHEILSF